MSNVISLYDRQTKAWEEYVAAQRHAQLSGRIEDGIAAGKAWRRWLDLFMTPDQRAAIGTKASA
ncbi:MULTISPECIES: hypothetical protein [unclassified Sinorhizobium]|uniref:hypothetical protein n=1 Tax=unclassified Sinorhizobium TaxID=2613772 RepID=UPI0035242FA9